MVEDSFAYYDPIWVFKLYIGYKYTYVGVYMNRHIYIKRERIGKVHIKL